MGAKGHKRHSAQAQIISAMLVFLVGIVILSGFTFLFNSIKDSVAGDIRSRAGEEVMAYIAIKAANLDKLHADYAAVTFPIPARLGGASYTISAAGGREILLSTQDILMNATSPVDISGVIDSSSEQAMLIYENGAITMRGVG